MVQLIIKAPILDPGTLGVRAADGFRVYRVKNLSFSWCLSGFGFGFRVSSLGSEALN